MTRILLALALLFAPLASHAASPGGFASPPDLSAYAKQGDLTATTATANAAKSSADASVKSVNGAAPTSGNVTVTVPSLAGYVKSVQAIGPDAGGNVSGVATQAIVQTAIVGVIQMSASPASGATIQANQGTTVLFVNNPSLLLALTVGLPPSPIDGQRFTVCTNAAITTMGFTGGTIKGALGSFSASGYARFIYSATLSAWFRAG